MPFDTLAECRYPESSMGNAFDDTSDKPAAVAFALEEHGLLRHFMGVVRALARGEEDSRQDLLDACAGAIRYFTESFPLLVADEDASIARRLEGRDASLDEAIRVMRDEHAALTPALERLVNELGRVRAEPEHPGHRAELLRLATTLSVEIERHLQAEERTVLAALGERVPASEQDRILGELRARHRG
jgi:hypothetical protein